MIRIIAIFVLNIFLAFYLFAEKTIVEEVKVLESQLISADGKEKMNIYSQLASLYLDISPEKTIDYANKAMNLASEWNEIKELALAHELKGTACRYMSQDNKALEQFKKALILYKSVGSLKDQSFILGKIAECYCLQGKYDVALPILLESLKIAETINSTAGIIGANTNIGVVYFNLKDYEKALEYYKTTEKYLEKSDDRRSKGNIANNIAMIYEKKEEYQKALEFYLTAADHFKAVEDLMGTAVSILNSGTIYQRLGNFDQVIQLSKEAMVIFRQMNYPRGIAAAINNIGEAYAGKKEFEKALEHFNKALKMFLEIGAKNRASETYECLIQLFVSNKDYKKAFDHQKKYYDLKETIFNEKSSQQLTEVQTKYDTLKKQRDLELAQSNLKLESRRKNLLIIGLAFVLVILILLFKRYLYLFSFWKKEKYISSYRVLNKIDTGGMGSVYKVHRVRDKSKEYAIKVLKDELFKDQNNIKRFKQEALLYDQLDHPNIVKIFERGEYQLKHYIVMELLRGETLGQRLLEEKVLDLSSCLHIVKQLLDVLSFIHNRNIIHRDLKPENIMLIEKDGQKDFVKLLDFGVAKMKLQTKITQTGSMIGTVDYMPPEQIMELGITSKSDVFSLGVIMYEALTGTRPFSGETSSDTISQILKAIPKPPNELQNNLPHGINDLILSMLKKYPKERISLQQVSEHIHEMEFQQLSN